MKKKLTIILISFFISFFLMIGLSFFCMERFNTYANYSDLMDHTNLILNNIYQAELHLKDISLNERGYMLTKDSTHKKHMYDAFDSVKNDIEDIEKLIIDNPIQQKNIDILQDSVEMRINAAKTNIFNFDTAHNYAFSKFLDSRQLQRACSRNLKKIHNIEDKLLAERFKGEQVYLELTTKTLSYIMLIFCLVTLILFIILLKELTSRIKYQDELQAKVIDLKRSHTELEDIAYVASHDLQEPLRKIQVFSNMLIYMKQNNIEDDSIEILKKINSLSNRMQILISDLRNLTSLTKIDELKTNIDLNRIIQYIVIDLDDEIKEKNVDIEIQNLPVIMGYENQIKILFKALFNNSLKFIKNDVAPKITISGKIVDGQLLNEVNSNLKNKKYYMITFVDNGIGFDNQYMNKIFHMFQKLHSNKAGFEGKGIGLTISQRIMANHEGYILADGRPKLYASFQLFFPYQG